MSGNGIEVRDPPEHNDEGLVGSDAASDSSRSAPSQEVVGDPKLKQAIEKMCAWEDHNYIMAAGAKLGSLGFLGGAFTYFSD